MGKRASTRTFCDLDTKMLIAMLCGYSKSKKFKAV